MRKLNFNPGPSALPEEVLRQAQKDLYNYKETGLSVMEMSHRSDEYQSIHKNAKQSIRQLLSVPDSHEILFLQGGASLQFSMVPMNFLHSDNVAYHVVTGSWAEKAYKEAKKLGSTVLLSDSADNNYSYVPSTDQWKDDLDPQRGYLHLTSNNTIYGTQLHSYDNLPNMPIVVDMSSDIGSKPVPWDRVSLAYAGAQKNLGPSGVTVVIIRKEWLSERNKRHTSLPAVLDYSVHAEKNSLYNTPPTFGVYMLGLMVSWMEKSGGLSEFIKRSQHKSSLIYQIIDESNGFYTGHAAKESRSQMNVTFRLPTPEMNTKFLDGATQKGILGLAGHRSIGGCRASLYNGVPVEVCEKLAKYMEDFLNEHQ